MKSALTPNVALIAVVAVAVCVVGVGTVAGAPYLSVFFGGVPLLDVPPPPPAPAWCCMW